MGATGFLNRPQHSIRPIKIVSWNIGGCKTKLEKRNVEEFLLRYDIVVLNEVKTSLHVCLPGYVSYMSYNKNCSHRGGTTIMLTNAISREVTVMDTSVPDQVWFQLRTVPKVVFGACYVPPSDSPYFTHGEFASMQERIMDNDRDYAYLILGDMNARFGGSVRRIVTNNTYTYPYIPDDVNTPNDNATINTPSDTDTVQTISHHNVSSP